MLYIVVYCISQLQIFIGTSYHNASVGPVLPLVLDQAVGEAVGGVGGVSDHPGPHQAGGRGGYILHTGGRGRIVDPDVAQTLPQRQTVFRIGVGQPSLHKQS